MTMNVRSFLSRNFSACIYGPVAGHHIFPPISLCRSSGNQLDMCNVVILEDYNINSYFLSLGVFL